MKKCLIMVLSSDWPPYDRLMNVSMETWDSVKVKGLETIFYCNGEGKQNTDKVIYIPGPTDIFSMGKKTLKAFEWALNNKEFDYICRPQANAYIHKPELIKYVQTLPDSNVFTGLECVGPPRFRWGVAICLSRDIVQKIVDNKDKWDHSKMEDVAMSELADSLGVPYLQGKACSIDKVSNDLWQCTAYGSDSFQFKSFEDINKAKGQYWFRCKQDYDRTKDEYVMRQIFKHLK